VSNSSSSSFIIAADKDVKSITIPVEIPITEKASHYHEIICSTEKELWNYFIDDQIYSEKLTTKEAQDLFTDTVENAFEKLKTIEEDEFLEKTSWFKLWDMLKAIRQGQKIIKLTGSNEDYDAIGALLYYSEKLPESDKI
jgi:hypothetical protein